jgi:hypothetical protein
MNRPLPHGQLLPAALRDLGWRIWSPDRTSIVRFDGGPSAPFSAAVHLNGWVWDGYLEWARRALRDSWPTAIEAIERLQAAECQGLFSSLWRGGGQVPSGLGWEHRVGGGRDEWHAVTGVPYLVLSVIHLPPKSRDYSDGRSFCAGTGGMRFTALVDGMPITRLCRDGDVQYAINLDTISVFQDVQIAMKAAERQAVARFAAMGIEHPMHLLDPRDQAFSRLVRERA